VGEGLLLGLEGLLKAEHLALQLPQPPDGGDTQGGGKGIVGALVQVEIVRGRNPVVLALVEPQELQGPVGQDLVHRHVGAGTCAPLEGVHGKVGKQLPAQQLPACSSDGIHLGRVGQVAEGVVHPEGRQLDGAEGPQEFGVGGAPQQGEVLQGSQAVDAMACRGGEFPGAEEIVFDAGFSHG